MKVKCPFLRGLAGFAIALLSLVVAGCAPATPQAAFMAGGQAAPTQVAMEEAEAMTEAPADFMGVDALEPPGAKSLNEGESQLQATPGPDDNPLVNALPQDRMIVKNGEITLLVQDSHAAVDQVTQIAVDNGGYVLTSQAAQDTFGVLNATLTIAVRADQFETAMRRLRQISLEVQNETSTGQDVTTEYVDLKSRLANLEATRDRIAALLEQAKDVEEALNINRQLSDIEGQIEQVKGRMTYLTGRSAFSTITVYLHQKVDATPTPTPTATVTPSPTPIWSLSPTIDEASSAQLSLLRGLLQLAVWIIFVPGPYLLVAGVGFWGYTRWSKRRNGNTPPTPPASGSSD